MWAKGTTVEMGTPSWSDSFKAIMRGRGDVNGDCRVDEVDLGLFRPPVLDGYPHPEDPDSGGGSLPTGRTFDYSADVNGDGVADDLDVQIVEENLGLDCSDGPT